MKSGDSAKHAGLSDISKKSDDVAQYYDEWANDYNETLMDWHYEAPSKIASMLCSALSLQSSILDAGCGTGLSGNALIGAGFSSIDGIDVSDRSLEVASKSGAYNTLRVMDMQRLPLDIPDDCYQGLVCVGVLTYLTDSISTLREFCRVTRPGGYVAMTQRSDLFTERSFQDVLDTLVKERLIAEVHTSEPQPYLPDNAEFGEEILVHYIGYRVV